MSLNLSADWHPPNHWTRVTTIEAHTAGEPLRVITSGFPDLPGNTILEKRRYLKEHYDNLRTSLMWEPRGHSDMYGCLLTPPVTEDGDLGVLFMHNEGYSTMCGHGIIGLVKVGLDCGLFTPADSSRIRIDTPAGRVTAQASFEGGCVDQVSFVNVPSFLLASQLNVQVEGVGEVTVDVAFGGAFYAYVEAAHLGLNLVPSERQQIVDLATKIKRAVEVQSPPRHPQGDEDLNFLYGTIMVGPPQSAAHSRNVCVFAEGEVDRSPTGTGVSGRAAILFARGLLPAGEPIRIESILGTCFDVEVVEEVRLGTQPAVRPQVTGRASITGRSEFLIDPEDPLKDGFLL